MDAAKNAHEGASNEPHRRGLQQRTYFDRTHQRGKVALVIHFRNASDDMHDTGTLDA